MNRLDKNGEYNLFPIKSKDEYVCIDVKNALNELKSKLIKIRNDWGLDKELDDNANDYIMGFRKCLIEVFKALRETQDNWKANWPPELVEGDSDEDINK